MDSIFIHSLTILLGITFSGNIYFLKRLITRLDTFESKLEHIHEAWHSTVNRVNVCEERIHNLKDQLKEIVLFYKQYSAVKSTIK